MEARRSILDIMVTLFEDKQDQNVENRFNKMEKILSLLEKVLEEKNKK